MPDECILNLFVWELIVILMILIWRVISKKWTILTFLSENKRWCYTNWRLYLYRSLKLIYYNPILGQIKGRKPAQGVFLTIITLKMNFSKITEWSSHRFRSIIFSSKKYWDYRKIWKFDFESRIVMRGWAKIES